MASKVKETTLKFTAGENLEISQVRSAIARPKDQLFNFEEYGTW